MKGPLRRFAAMGAALAFIGGTLLFLPGTASATDGSPCSRTQHIKYDIFRFSTAHYGGQTSQSTTVMPITGRQPGSLVT